MSDRFYLDLPVFPGFADLIDPAFYQPLPADWIVGITDVVSSTAAIADGRYKAVNMAGAASIAALMNALETMTLPFVFGGDGASFAVAPHNREMAGEALARTSAFVRDEYNLDLRTALVPMAEIRAAGKDVQVARFGPSRHVSYTMFRGGGLAWATDEMKKGRYAVTAAPPGFHPDLSGLSCRFSPSATRLGVMLSVIVAPQGAETPAFDALVGDILTMAGDTARAARPFGALEDLTLRWPAEGLELEVSAHRISSFPRWCVRLERLIFTRLATFLMNSNRNAGQFNARRYKDELIANVDYRKFDDGLRLTLDCTPDLADALEERLKAARDAGIATYGLHRQKAAIMTCFVPAPSDSNHIHFVDGADGGYAVAAKAMKALG